GSPRCSTSPTDCPPPRQVWRCYQTLSTARGRVPAGRHRALTGVIARRRPGATGTGLLGRRDRRPSVPRAAHQRWAAREPGGRAGLPDELERVALDPGSPGGHVVRARGEPVLDPPPARAGGRLGVDAEGAGVVLGDRDADREPVVVEDRRAVAGRLDLAVRTTRLLQADRRARAVAVRVAGEDAWVRRRGRLVGARRR